jgi:hypothetical protein
VEELLMVLFGLLCLHFHQSARRLEERRIQHGNGAASFFHVWKWHALAWLCFVLACMSNAVGAVIPAIVLMQDLVIGRVRSVRRILTGNLPMWAIAVGAVLLKLSHQDIPSVTQNLRTLVNMPPSERFYTALSLYAYNWWTIVWPRHLILAYPNLLVISFFAICSLAGLALVVLTLVVLWRLRHRPCSTRRVVVVPARFGSKRASPPTSYLPSRPLPLSTDGWTGMGAGRGGPRCHGPTTDCPDCSRGYQQA